MVWRRRLLLFPLCLVGIVNGQRWKEERGAGAGGDSVCPCIETMPILSADEVDSFASIWNNGKASANEVAALKSAWSGGGNSTLYGMGCANHDFGVQACSDYEECSNGDQSTILQLANTLPDCPNTWCARSWCFVDTNNCKNLASVPVPALSPDKNISYSYATCGEPDYFAREAQISTLRGKILNVGFNHNSGGWAGSYSRNENHFEGPGSVWYGPAVEFVKEAAQVGNFRINLTAPPEKLLNLSQEYFSSSRFDYCIYATGLGYLDFCVASYTITNKRALAAEWFTFDSLPLYMLTYDTVESSSIEIMKTNFLTIFKPFTGSTWLIVMLGFLPFLAFTMMLQELGMKGSDFPATEKKMVDSDDGLPPEEKEVAYPMWKNVNRALFLSLRSYLRRAYGKPVQSYGASWTVLAYCFIGMIGMSLYTAQMAAHLTTDSLKPEVDNLDDAILAGYRLCAARKNAELVINDFGLDANQFVRDPIELGGDGGPGFNCPNCAARRRTIDFLDPLKARTDDNYCHAALATSEEVEVLQSDGLYCNLKVSGQPIAYKQFGFPISSPNSKALRSLFFTLKNNGVYERKKRDATPDHACPITELKAKSLTPYDLVGIWVMCAGFAIIGSIVSFIERRKALKSSVKSVAKESVRLGHIVQGSIVHRS